MDPDADPDPAMFVIDLQATKTKLKKSFSAYYFFKVHLHYSSKIKVQKMSQNSKNQGFSYYFAWQQKDDRRIRIQIHSADFWIRIQEAQKHVDPVGPDSDPQHCPDP